MTTTIINDDGKIGHAPFRSLIRIGLHTYSKIQDTDATNEARNRADCELHAHARVMGMILGISDDLYIQMLADAFYADSDTAPKPGDNDYPSYFNGMVASAADRIEAKDFG